jgi:DNA gyrase subunit A
MVITTHGIVIRVPLEQIRVIGRNSQGVKIINLEGRQKVAAIAIVPHEDVSEEPVEEAEGEQPEASENETQE